MSCIMLEFILIRRNTYKLWSKCIYSHEIYLTYPNFTWRFNLIPLSNIQFEIQIQCNNFIVMHIIQLLFLHDVGWWIIGKECQFTFVFRSKKEMCVCRSISINFPDISYTYSSNTLVLFLVMNLEPTTIASPQGDLVECNRTCTFPIFSLIKKYFLYIVR